MTVINCLYKAGGPAELFGNRLLKNLYSKTLIKENLKIITHVRTQLRRIYIYIILEIICVFFLLLYF